MTERSKYETGEFCWSELSTSDTAAAKDFYTSLFGWEADDQELPEGMGVYTTFRLNGKAVCACTPQGEHEAGIPPHWNLYISVDDLDTCVKKTESAGGSIVVQPMDVMDLGRMAVISDPTGGVVGLWQPASMHGADVIGEPGAFIWAELATGDPDKATAFYSEVLGYDTDTMQLPEAPPYTLLKVSGNDNGIAGIMATQDPSQPVAWTTYFMAADCAALEAKAGGLGAKVIMPTTQIPTVGKFAFLIDPTGAMFAILEPDPNAPQ